MNTVIITGASRGIGLSTAKKFLDEGWFVIGTYNNTDISIENDNLKKIKLDLEQLDSVTEAREQIEENYDGVDVLINNAGVILDAHDDEVDMEKLVRTFKINLFSLIEFTEGLLSSIKSGGDIVNISSILGSFTMPIYDGSAVSYRMCKAALNMYTRSLAARLKDQNICVSSFDPGWVKTDMGYEAASGSVGPDISPEQSAQEIYDLITKKVESGKFWKNGQIREW